MKRALIVPLLLLFFSTTSFTLKKDKLSVQDALQQKKISISIAFDYVRDNHDIELSITNLTSEVLDLALPVGSIFLPDDTGAQTLVTAQEQYVMLEKSGKKKLPLYAFCTQLHHHGSDTSSTFTLGFTNRPKVLAIAKYLDSLGSVSIRTKQEAIWCVSDGEDVSNVYLEDTARSHALRKKLCALTGQADTWYTTEREITQDEELNFIPVPTEVKGNITFHTDKSVPITGVITDDSGNILQSDDRSISAGPGNVTFEFELTVEGWPAGTYHVVYMSNGKELLNQAFTI